MFISAPLQEAIPFEYQAAILENNTVIQQRIRAGQPCIGLWLASGQLDVKTICPSGFQYRLSAQIGAQTGNGNVDTTQHSPRAPYVHTELSYLGRFLAASRRIFLHVDVTPVTSAGTVCYLHPNCWYKASSF